MSRTRTPTTSPPPTAELTRDVKQDVPPGYLVFPAEVKTVDDYELFRTLHEAEEFAEEQMHTFALVDDWPIYPLYASHRVVNKSEPGREA